MIEDQNICKAISLTAALIASAGDWGRKVVGKTGERPVEKYSPSDGKLM